MGYHGYGQVSNPIRRPFDGPFKRELITPNPKLKLLEQVREVTRLKHYRKGLNAHNVIAWAGASPTSAGPGQRRPIDLLSPVKGDTTVAETIDSRKPQLLLTRTSPFT